ncbi:hypothetical protein NP569_25165, partial [Vibrio parahaemolyticus]|nr:hypothetical protein [Vibrio parahaemolyticus]
AARPRTRMIDLRSSSKKPTEPKDAGFPDIPLCLYALAERSKHKNGENGCAEIAQHAQGPRVSDRSGASDLYHDALHRVKTCFSPFVS